MHLYILGEQNSSLVAPAGALWGRKNLDCDIDLDEAALLLEVGASHFRGDSYFPTSFQKISKAGLRCTLAK